MKKIITSLCLVQLFLFGIPDFAKALTPAPIDPTPIEVCEGSLSQCQTNLTTCVGDLTASETALTSCSASLSDSQSAEADCQADLTTSNAETTYCVDKLTTCSQEKESAEEDNSECTNVYNITYNQLGECQDKQAAAATQRSSFWECVDTLSNAQLAKIKTQVLKGNTKTQLTGFKKFQKKVMQACREQFPD